MLMLRKDKLIYYGSQKWSCTAGHPNSSVGRTPILWFSGFEVKAHYLKYKQSVIVTNMLMLRKD